MKTYFILTTEPISIYNTENASVRHLERWQIVGRNVVSQVGCYVLHEAGHSVGESETTTIKIKVKTITEVMPSKSALVAQYPRTGHFLTATNAIMNATRFNRHNIALIGLLLYCLSATCARSAHAPRSHAMTVWRVGVVSPSGKAPG